MKAFCAGCDFARDHGDRAFRCGCCDDLRRDCYLLISHNSAVRNDFPY